MAEEDQPAGPPRLIHAGPWRSGTASMAAAYRQLGLRAHHTNDRFYDFKMFELLELAAEGKWPDAPGARPRKQFTRAEWDEVFGEWDVITDGGSDHIAELVEAYPDVKLVIVERDFDKWWTSYEGECLEPLFGWANVIPGMIVTSLTDFRGFPGMRKTVLGAFGARNVTEVRQRAREYHTNFYKNVRKLVPPERKLEYKLGSGWEPLCQFLDKPVPNTPFPRANDAKAHREHGMAFLYELLYRAWKNVRLWLLGSLTILAIGIWMARS